MNYYDFDFKRDKDFFKFSPTYQYLKNKIEENKFMAKIEPDILKASVNLWIESVIKHNLCANCANIDTYNFISKENSPLVLKIFGKIFNKEKSQKTPQDFEALRHQSSVQNGLVMISLQQLDTADVWENLKKEFLDFRLKNEVVKKNKIKP